MAVLMTLSMFRASFRPDNLYASVSLVGVAPMDGATRSRRSKGMSLVGCDVSGVNAFFVKGRFGQGAIPEPFDAKTHWEPPQYHLAIRRGHPASV
jgi:hypothetical protein